MSSMYLYSQRGKDDSYLDAIVNNETYLQMCSDSNDKIVDLMVMYYGANGRPKYTKEELKSYVFRYNDSGKFEWLFDGFLFLEDRTEVDLVEKGYAFEQNAYLFQKHRARKQEWMWLLDRTFDPNEGLSALNDLISEFSAIEKPPLRKRKVILSLPEPLSGQLDWGQLNNKTLDFANDSDRVKAVKWYVDELISRFNIKNFKNLELSGFYWFRTNDELSFQLMPEIASYIHSKGYKFYWRPSYGRFRGSAWKSYGFDAAYLTPDHLTTSWFKKINVVRACTYASEYSMGLEIDLNKLVKQYGNYRTKFEDYMNVYKDSNVFDKAAMSYQDGDGIFYEMSKTSNGELNNIYNRILNEVVIRQKIADLECMK
jgi:hypothetical protein